MKRQITDLISENLLQIYPGSPLIHNKMLIGITYGYSGKSKRQYIVSFLIGLFDDKIKEMISDQ